jgi:hypothetical protein
MNTLFTFIAASTAFITVASSAQVILFNGTTVTQKLPVEIFLTEGPIWDIDIPGRTLTAVGQVIQIPASINGVPFTLEGTEKLSPSGATLGSITAADFDRLSDINAVGRDLVNTSAGEDVGPYRLGPVRSIFSTSEARSNVVGALDRSPATQRVIEDNYFRILINLFNVHQSVLSAEFLGRCGVRTAQGQYPTNPFQLPPRTYWKYPHSTGGTLKSAGTIYVDAAGNEYRIPHDGCVIELAENVTAGKVRSMQKGSDLTPISFVVNETIVTLNPDPRIETKILGIAGREVDPSILAASLQVGDEVVIVGYLVGEHMLFGIEIDAPTLYVESMGIIVSADRFTAQVNSGRLRWRGQLYPPAGKTLWVQLAGSKELIPVPFVVDPANGIGTYDMRLDGIDLEAVTALDMVVRDATTGAELQREHFDFTDSIAP